MSEYLFHTPNVTSYHYNKSLIFSKDFLGGFIQQSIDDFIDDGLATLITSSASFMKGSVRGSYGSGSGESSAVVDKLLVRRKKINTEAKI
jgi:hypothetical protein